MFGTEKWMKKFLIHYRIPYPLSLFGSMRKYFERIPHSLFDKWVKNIISQLFKGRRKTVFCSQIREMDEGISGSKGGLKNHFFSSQRKNHITRNFLVSQTLIQTKENELMRESLIHFSVRNIRVKGCHHTLSESRSS